MTEVSFRLMMLRSYLRLLIPLVVVGVILGCATTTPSYPALSILAQSDPLAPEEFRQLREDVEALGAVFNVDRRGEHALY